MATSATSRWPLMLSSTVDSPAATAKLAASAIASVISPSASRLAIADASRARSRLRLQLILFRISLQGRLDRGPVILRREQADEIVDEAASINAWPQSETRRAGAEQVTRVDLLELLVAIRVVRHLRDDADSETDLDIGLDHVRVERGQHHVRREPLGGEGSIDLRSARE